MKLPDARSSNSYTNELMESASGCLCGVYQVRQKKINDEMLEFREFKQQMAKDIKSILGIKGMNVMPRVPKENYIPPAYVQENIDILNVALARKKPKNHPKPLDRKERAKRRAEYDSRMMEQKMSQ